MCDCDRALELISLELDGQLTPEERTELETHLAACEECRGAAEELRQIHTLLPELEEEVPQGLHQAIMDRIGAEKVVPISRAGRKSHLRQWASLAAVFAVILLGAGGLKTLQSGSSTSTAPAVASVDTAEADQNMAGIAGSDAEDDIAEQPEAASKEKEAAVSGDTASLPGESQTMPVQADVNTTEGSGEATLRMSPPASDQPTQPTPAPTQTAEGDGNTQESVSQAVAFGVMPADAAPNEEVQPDEGTTETLKANCIAWLAGASLEQKDRVDTTLVSIVRITEGDLAAVCDDESAALLDAADWAVTLGDTSGHDYVILLCDSETLAVLGYVPIA